jgi:hypothetical protein
VPTSGGSRTGGVAHWRAHPILARIFVTLAYGLPIAGAVGTVELLERLWTTSAGAVVARWIVILGAAAMAFVAIESVTRRALPWARLLRLRMSFNGPAPRRWVVARDLWSLSNDGTLDIGEVGPGGALVAAQALFAATFGPRSARAFRLIAAGAVAVACTLVVLALQSVIGPTGGVHPGAVGRPGVPPGAGPFRSGTTLWPSSGALAVVAISSSEHSSGSSVPPPPPSSSVHRATSSLASASEQYRPSPPPSDGGVSAVVAKAPATEQPSSQSGESPPQRAPGTTVSVKVGADGSTVGIGVTIPSSPTVTTGPAPPVTAIVPVPTVPVSLPPLPVNVSQPSVSLNVTQPSVSLDVTQPSVSGTVTLSVPTSDSGIQVAPRAAVEASIAGSTLTVSLVADSTVTVSTSMSVATPSPSIATASPLPSDPAVPPGGTVAGLASDPVRAASVDVSATTVGQLVSVVSPVLDRL